MSCRAGHAPTIGQRLQAFGKCLDINGASTANGAKIQLRTCTAAANQRWTLP